MTKKEAKWFKAEWSAALADGRIVRFSSTHLTSYPTKEQAQKALRSAIAGGFNAEIVVVAP